MITGCTANYLGIDGKSEADMTDEQRLNAWKYITKAMNEHIPKSDDLNQLLQFLLSQWGEWEYDPQALGERYFNVNTEFHNYTPVLFDKIEQYFIKLKADK